MGIISEEVRFEGQAPEAARIADKVTEIIGLPMTLEESGPEMRCDCHFLHARLAFARFPDRRVELTAYHPGGVKEFLKRMGTDTLPIAHAVQGANEPPGTQTVYIRGYIGQEPTIIFATILALEALGGHLREPVSEEMRREYGSRITTMELDRRHRKLFRQGLVKLLLGVILLPILFPLGVASIVWHLVKTPWQIRKAMKLVRSRTDRRPGGA
ncbi:MAG: hypothetical protein JWN24_2803 [Phycisphaerales bacterium]|nr:hypothetical protein [Phycisphaerales bacterium]